MPTMTRGMPLESVPRNLVYKLKPARALPQRQSGRFCNHAGLLVGERFCRQRLDQSCHLPTRGYMPMVFCSGKSFGANPCCTNQDQLNQLDTEASPARWLCSNTTQDAAPMADWCKICRQRLQWPRSQNPRN